MSKRFSAKAVWRYMPQFFVGLFFLAAAYLKWSEALFGPHRIALDVIFQHWLDHKLPLGPYAEFMKFALPYADVLAWVTLLFQAAAGLLLILNIAVPVAGGILFFVQLNIYLATYHHPELLILGSQALWLGLFFFARKEMNGRLWTLMTCALSLIGLLHLYWRMKLFGDPWFSSYTWQRTHYATDVMSSWPGLKVFVLWLTSGSTGPLLWVSLWWIKIVLALGLLTRYRLYFGAAWLITIFIGTLVWFNAWTVEGVFWVLVLFVWLTHEWILQTARPPSRAKRPRLKAKPAYRSGRRPR